MEGFKALGAKVKKSNLNYLVTLENQPKRNIEIFFREASVTATENLILASALRPGTVILKNCAKEPHVIDLCKMISQMGGQIAGIGSDTLTITGVDKLYGTKFRIGMDCIEAGTYMIAAAITGGKVEIKGVDSTDISPIQSSLKEFGIKTENQEGSLHPRQIS